MWLPYTTDLYPQILRSLLLYKHDIDRWKMRERALSSILDEVINMYELKRVLLLLAIVLYKHLNVGDEFLQLQWF